MESDYTSLLKSKHVEVEQANEKIEELLAGMEQLQSSNNEKDDTILKLKTNLAKIEEDTNKSKKEISRLHREIELLRKSRSALNTPILNRCKAEPSTCSLGSNKDDRDKSRPLGKKESAGSQVFDPVKDTEKDCRRSSKRKGVETISFSGTPRLFSSTFKVPKGCVCFERKEVLGIISKRKSNFCVWHGAK